MSRLLLRLPPSTAATETVLTGWSVQPDGSVTAVQGTLAQWTQQRAAEVVALVPAALLSWHRATLPEGLKLQGDARCLPVLQNTLEEALLVEPEQVHVALPPEAQAGQPTLLAVCDQAWLGGWLQALESAGLRLSRVLPEVPPDALESGTAWATGAEHQAWVSVATADGPLLTLPLAPESAPWLAEQQVLALPGVYRDAARSVGEAQAQLWAEADYAARVLASRWDLAQHGFAINAWERGRRQVTLALRTIAQAPQWRAARWALVAWAAVAVVGLNAQAWWQGRQLVAKRAAATALVQQTFPQLRVVVDAPLQMQREIDQLRRASGVVQAHDLQPLMAAAGRALAAQPWRPQRVEYVGDALLLQGLPAQAEEALRAALAGSGYGVQLEGGTLRVTVEVQ